MSEDRIDNMYSKKTALISALSLFIGVGCGVIVHVIDDGGATIRCLVFRGRDGMGILKMDETFEVGQVVTVEVHGDQIVVRHQDTCLRKNYSLGLCLGGLL